MIMSAAFQPRRFAASFTSSVDKTARVWERGHRPRDAVLSEHTNFVCFAAFSPDGSRVRHGVGRRDRRVWEPQRPTATVLPHGKQCVSGLLHPDGHALSRLKAQCGAHLGYRDGARDRGAAPARQPRAVCGLPPGRSARSGGVGRTKTARIWDAPIATMSTKASWPRHVCGSGLTKLTRDEMRSWDIRRRARDRVCAGTDAAIVAGTGMSRSVMISACPTLPTA